MDVMYKEMNILVLSWSNMVSLWVEEAGKSKSMTEVLSGFRMLLEWTNWKLWQWFDLMLVLSNMVQIINFRRFKRALPG
jgi:hypothetical protein